MALRVQPEMASVYGVLKGSEPFDGVWLVHKHIPTGELLGPSVPRNMPTRVVRAYQTRDGWKEIVG